jgi:uncharacterized GH25 family protein
VIKHSIRIVTAVALAAAAMAASAHRPWLLPSSVMAEAGRQGPAIVSVDAAISEDLFDFDSFAIQVNDLTVVAPDGSKLPTENRSAAKRRTTFDVQLPQKGTYRIVGVTDSAFATWKVGGETKRWRGAIDAISQNVPANAADLRVTQMLGRVETFVSNDSPSAVPKPALDTGLALVPVTSPTDLSVGDTSRFVLTLDGKPLPNADVTVIRGGNRYRYKMGEIALKTGADGSFSVAWPEAGRYWLGVSHGARPAGPDAPAPAGPTRRDSYSATFEVLPR